MVNWRELFCNEQFILTAIVLNTIVMFLGGFWPGNLWFELSDALFTFIFLIEALIKIAQHGWKDYWSLGWNRFDLIILIIALPVEQVRPHHSDHCIAFFGRVVCG